jgi:hypothetical protein
MRAASPDDPVRTGISEDYFLRRAERLLLGGYRYWTAGFRTGSITPWEMSWSLYAEALGQPNADRLTTDMQAFVHSLRLCGSCPLKAFPFNARYLCLEECLTIGLIASLQGDKEVAEFCLQRLGCPANCEPVRVTAQRLADTLADLDARLLPVSQSVIDEIIRRVENQRARLSANPSTTHH